MAAKIKIFACALITAAVWLPSRSAANVIPPENRFKALYDVCSAKQQSCYDFIEGMLGAFDLDALLYFDAKPADDFRICIPEGTTKGAAGKVVANYGDRHPEQWSHDRTMTAARALHESWPCK